MNLLKNSRVNTDLALNMYWWDSFIIIGRVIQSSIFYKCTLFFHLGKLDSEKLFVISSALLCVVVCPKFTGSVVVFILSCVFVLFLRPCVTVLHKTRPGTDEGDSRWLWDESYLRHLRQTYNQSGGLQHTVSLGHWTRFNGSVNCCRALNNLSLLNNRSRNSIVKGVPVSYTDFQGWRRRTWRAPPSPWEMFRPCCSACSALNPFSSDTVWRATSSLWRCRDSTFVSSWDALCNNLV